MRLSPGNKPTGKAGTRTVARDRNIPVQRSAPQKQKHGTAPKSLLSAWQHHSPQSEKGPRSKTQDFSPKTVTLKSESPHPTSSEFRHIPDSPSSAMGQTPTNSAAGPDPVLTGLWGDNVDAGPGREDPAGKRPCCRTKGTGCRPATPGSGAEPSGQSQQGTACYTALATPIPAAVSPLI